VVPIVPGGSDPTPPPVPSAAPTPYSTAGAWYRDVGYIGLPPEDATPSGSGPGVLIGQYSISPEPPYIGSAFLYADGRLVWNEHTQEWSTGWLEQRLTTEGMDLAQELVTETTAFACCPEGQWMVLDPRQLPDVLPSSAWADKTVRPYVASAFAACVGGDKLGVYPFQQAEVTLEEMLALLPSGARDMLTGRPEVVPEDGTELPSCFEMSTAEARLLDAVFRDAHWEQDERMNRLILEYHTDFSRDPADWRLWVYFAQILPHGVVGAAIGG
jgi:hypothetical protein